MSRPGDAEAVNRAAWTKPTTLRWFGELRGWSDEGERASILALAREFHGRRILDLGVGAGRTVELLRQVSHDYTALDFLPSMVAQCARRHPDANVAVGDARDLVGFADGSIDLLVFSWNGIDAVSHEERRQILREAARVLAPGGAFLFSTHNRSGPGWQERPWTVRRRDLRHPRHMLARMAWLPVDVRNHLRLRSRTPGDRTWGMANAAAHHFSLVIHYTTLPAQLAELTLVGFTEVEARDCEHGRILDPSVDTSDVWWFQIVARKAAAHVAADHSTERVSGGSDRTSEAVWSSSR